jgi:hypothetical protein
MRVGLLVMVALSLALLSGCGGGAMSAKATPDAAYGPQMEMEEGGDADYGYSTADGAEVMTPAAEMPPEPADMPMLAQVGGENRDGDAAPGRPPATSTAPPPAPSAKPDVKPVTSGKQPEVAEGKLTPLLIYTAHFHMGVYESAKSIDAVDALAKEMGGYLVRRDQNSITVRVPAEKYKGALDAIGKLGDVLHREESVEDVTDQFYDLVVRIKNARAMRDRLEDLLKQAKDVKEALAVERELARVTAEIESMEGRLKRMRELISFSTITVDFKPRPVETINSKVRLPFGWLDHLGLSNLLSL